MSGVWTNRTNGRMRWGSRVGATVSSCAGIGTVRHGTKRWEATEGRWLTHWPLRHAVDLALELPLHQLGRLLVPDTLATVGATHEHFRQPFHLRRGESSVLLRHGRRAATRRQNGQSSDQPCQELVAAERLCNHGAASGRAGPGGRDGAGRIGRLTTTRSTHIKPSDAAPSVPSPAATVAPRRAGRPPAPAAAAWLPSARCARRPRHHWP